MIFLCSPTVNVFVDLPDRWDFFSSMWENKTVINIYIFFTLNTESILYVMLAVQQIKQIRLVGSLQCPSNDARRALQHIPTTRRKKKQFFVPVPLSLSCFFFFSICISQLISLFSQMSCGLFFCWQSELCKNTENIWMMDGCNKTKIKLPCHSAEI